LEISEIYDKALKYFTIGRAFDSDENIQNLTMSKKAIVMFSRELKKAKGRSSKDFTGTNAQYNSPYIGGV